MDSPLKKVLVVDDDAFVADLLAMILSESGFDVVSVANGRLAWETLQEKSDFDLIISDMNMPEMSGLELLHQVRQAGHATPLIILTGNNEISVAIEAMNNGANDYLLKDENIQDTILLAAEKVLEKFELAQKNQQLMRDLEQRHREMAKEKAIACKVQENILPKEVSFAGFSTGTFYQPSDMIGGDFFDAWEKGRFTHFLIGDISGHSTSSALIMAVCKGMFHSLGQTIDSPCDIVRKANEMLSPILMDSGMFLTLALATFDREKETLEIVSGGHNPVFLIKNGELHAVDSTGPVLGWDPDDSWESVEHPFAPGEKLFLYTDGLVEARNAQGEEFEEYLPPLLKNAPDCPQEMVTLVQEQLHSFCRGTYDDDLTLFSIGRV